MFRDDIDALDRAKLYLSNHRTERAA